MNFKTLAEYNVCFDAATTVIEGCNEMCSVALGAVVEDCLTTESSTQTMCEDTFSMAALVCDMTADGCSNRAGMELTMCLDMCAAIGGPGCDAGCNTVYNMSILTCSNDQLSCKLGADSIQQPCIFNAHTESLMCQSMAQSDFYTCDHDCCSTKDTNPVPCDIDCQKDLLTCQDTVVTAQRSCGEGCIQLLVNATWCNGDSTMCPGDFTPYRHCQSACDDPAVVAQSDCTQAQQSCQTDCTIQDERAQKCCGWYQTWCNEQCQIVYEESQTDCRHAQLVSLQECVNTNADCVDACDGDEGCIAACGIEQTMCEDMANDAYDGCNTSFLGALYDCKYKCCTNVQGSDESNNAVKECWHSSGCALSSDLSDCTDAFQACVGMIDGVYSNTLPTCNTCAEDAGAPPI